MNLSSLIKKRKFIGISLSAIFIVGFIFCSTLLTAEAYDFGKDSGLITTAREAGYNENETPQPEAIIGQGIQAILGFLGVLFLALIIYAGFTWMIAQGNDQKVTRAKNIMEGAAIGLIIVIMAYAISSFIINYFSSTVKTR